MSATQHRLVQTYVPWASTFCVCKVQVCATMLVRPFFKNGYHGIKMDLITISIPDNSLYFICLFPD